MKSTPGCVAFGVSVIETGNYVEQCQKFRLIPNKQKLNFYRMKFITEQTL